MAIIPRTCLPVPAVRWDLILMSVRMRLCMYKRNCSVHSVEALMLFRQVDAEKQRFSVTLKPGLVAAQDASLLRSLFADMEFVARLRHVVNCMSMHATMVNHG